MTTYDLTPLYRSTIGFDRLARLMDATLRANGGDPGYPPYDILAVGDNEYRISMALAGFERDDLDIQVHEQTLTVSGNAKDDAEDATYLHRGIAERSFVRRFQLADHVKVTNARFDNGLLTIELEHDLPEEMRPRKVSIETGGARSLTAKARKLLEGGKDAA